MNYHYKPMHRTAEITSSRLVRQLVWNVVIVLASVFLLYPLLHELGHALAAWLFGGEVVRITIYPAFYTECAIHSDQMGCYIATAMAGVLFPLLLSAVMSLRGERSFLLTLCLRVMSVGYAAGEVFGVSRCILGSMRETSDLSVLLYKTGADPYAALVLAGFLLILSVLLLVIIEPVQWFAAVSERVAEEEEAARRASR